MRRCEAGAARYVASGLGLAWRGGAVWVWLVPVRLGSYGMAGLGPSWQSPVRRGSRGADWLVLARLVTARSGKAVEAR